MIFNVSFEGDLEEAPHMWFHSTIKTFLIYVGVVIMAYLWHIRINSNVFW